MRLIDADKLKISYDGHFVGVAKNDLDNAPTVEAQPITHAHWEIGINGDKFCSNCGTYAGFAYRGSRKYQELSNYCRYCSAKMDEKVED